nr:hypothetical protein [Tanacetum cinerariifolium]
IKNINYSGCKSACLKALAVI